MDSRKIFIFLLVFLCMLSIASVSAEDGNNDTLINNEDVKTTADNITVADTSYSQDSEILSAGTGSFSELSSEMWNGLFYGSVSLTKDYAYSKSSDSMYSTGVPVYFSVTINGNGHTIDAKGLTRIFNIMASNVIINNVTFVNGNMGYGGAIYWSGSGGSVYNSNFINCVANTGGAIYWESNSGSVYNSYFIENTAYYTGGSISLTGTGGTISNSVFINSTSPQGGAVYGVSSAQTITDSTFIGGIADYGGAIFDLNSTININNCLFEDNYAESSGGAIYKMYNSLSLSNSEFYYNYARDGGAVCIDYFSSFTSSNSVFAYNTVRRYGGAICLMFNSQFNNNTNRFSDNDALKGDDIYLMQFPDFDIGSNNYTMFYYNPEIPSNTPSYYNSVDEGYVTSVKNQGSEGNCWAFAACAALESAILKATGITYDFSEENMKNIAAYFSDYGKNMSTNSGGSYWMVLSYLASWLGPVYESDDPYIISNLFSPIINSVMHVQDVVYIKRDNASDIDGIKKAVMAYGAVATTIYYSSSYLSSVYGYYYPEVTGINHAVTIVGWDDSYSRNNFRTAPEGDGAFIVKNSWGPTWGDKGYFYVSYYDKSFAYTNGAVNYAFILNDTVRYDNHYQHETGQSYYWWYESVRDNINPNEITYGEIWARNVFTAGENEFISAVSTFFDVDSDYEVYINVTHNNVSELKLTQKGSVLAGYHTIKLNSYVPIEKGDVFSVTIKYIGYSYLPVASDDQLVRPVSYEGISYGSWNGVKWVDLNKYGVVACVKAFTVSKVNTTINVEHLNSVEIEKQTEIKATVYDQFKNPVNNGQVTFTINNKEYVVNVTDGVAKLNIALNNSGITNIYYLFTASNYYSSNRTSQISVYRHASKLDISVNDIYYSQSAKVTVKANGATGKVTIKVDNIIKTVDIKNDEASYTFTNLNVNTYTVNVNYGGDSKYNESSSQKTFNVKKANSTITVNTYDIIYGNNISVAVSWVNGSSGSYVLNRGGSVVRSGDLAGSIVLSGLVSGDYTVTVYNDGDANHNGSYEASSFKVINASSSITVNTYDIIYGNNISVAVSWVNGSSGSYVLNRGGSVVRSGDLAGSIVLSGLVSGDYTVTVYNDGDANHNGSYATSSFKVIRAGSSISLTVSNITYGGDVTVNTVLVNSTSGSYIISKNGITIKSGVLSDTITLSKPAGGNYTITAINNGDSNHNSSTTKRDFTVKQANSNINIITSDATYGSDVTIKFILTEATTGNVYVSISKDNKIINTTTVNTNNNIIRFNNLNVSSYDVSVKYSGDVNFTGSENTSKFSVLKANSIVSLAVDNVTYGSKVNVNVNLINTTSVSYELIKNNIIIKSADLNGNLIFDDLGAGNYTLHAENKGDLNHNAGHASVSFEVKKANSNIDIQPVTNVLYGNPVTVNFNKTEGSSGDVNVSIFKNNVLVENKTSKKQVTFNALAAGEYKVLIKYSGDDNFTGSENTSKFSVIKAASVVSLTVNDIVYGEDVNVNVSLTNGSKGHFELIRNGTVTDSGNNINNIILAGLSAGNYTVTVYNDGDENHNSSVSSADFKVKKAASSIVIDDISDITYGSPVKIEFKTTLYATGNVKVSIFKDNNLIVNKTVSVSDSAVTFNNLNASLYNVSFEYLGDVNFTDCKNTSQFSVVQADSGISATGRDAVYGNDVVVSVALVNGTSGSFELFKGNIQLKTGNISDEIVLSDLSAGNYTIKVKNNGDNNHKSSENTADFKVDKFNSHITADLMGSIVYGSPITVNFNVNSKATGNVKISILKNDTLIANKTVNVADGSVIFIDLNVSNYNILFEYSGDVNFTDCKNTSLFSVVQADSGISATCQDAVYGNDVVVSVALVNGTSASFELFKGNSFVRAGNISDETVLSDLSAGNYTIKVKNNVDNNHKSSENRTDFTVKQAQPSLMIKVIENITYGGEIIIEFNTDTKATGNVKASIFKENELIISKTVNVGDKKVIFPTLDVNTYTVTVEYSGDINFTESKSDSKINIEPAGSAVLLPEIVNRTYGEDITIEINLINGSDGYYDLTKNSTLVKSDYLNGNIVLRNLSAGNYSIAIYNNADNNHKNSSLTSKFTIKQAESTISIKNIQNTIYGGELTMVFDVTQYATGNVKISVIKENDLISFKTVNAADGKATFTDINASNYTVLFEYSGDVNFSGSKNSSQFNIIKAASAIVAENISNITYGENITVNVGLANGTSGSFLLVKNESVIKSGEISDRIILSDLSAGNYMITITNNGDENHNSSEYKANFTVNKYTPLININMATTFIYGNDVVVRFNTNRKTTGNLWISILKDDEVINTTNVNVNTNEVIFSNLNASLYNLTIEYSGDINYTKNTNSTLFNIIKATSGVYLTCYGTVYGGDAGIDMDLINGTSGSYKLFKDNQIVQSGELSDNLIFSGLSAGNYTVCVLNDGDSNHNSSENKSSFTVGQAVSAVLIAADSSFVYGDNVTISFNVTEGATGNIRVLILKDNEIINTTVVSDKVTFYNLNASSYTISCEYSGDINYTKSESTSQFNVVKASSAISLESENITYGSDVNIKADFINGTSGSYTLFKDDLIVKSGELQDKLVFSGLSAGNYTVCVLNDGDSNHNSSENKSSFTVGQAVSAVLIAADSSFVYGDNVTISFNVTEGATGNVKITISEDMEIILNVSDKKTTINNLNTSSYNISIEYLGDINYTGSTDSTIITIVQADSSILILNNQNITYGDIKTVNVKLINGSSANYTLTKDNLTVQSGIMTDNITFNRLDAGNYTFHVENSGDKNHKSSISKAEFTVGQATPLVTININSTFIYGDNITVNFNVTEGATGDVKVIISKNNEIINTNVTQNRITFKNLNVSDYNISIEYLGDNNYITSQNNTNFSISKANSDVLISRISDSDYGNNITIKATLTNGTEGIYNLFKDNYLIKTDSISNIATLSNLDAGEYVIIIENNGDLNHKPSTSTSTFKINPASSLLSVNIDDSFVYGDDIIINYTISKKATGNVSVSILSKNNIVANKTVSLSDDTFIFNDLNTGSYDVVVEYLGDNNYLSAKSSSAFKVSQANSSVFVNLSDDIEYGDILSFKTILINGTSGIYSLFKGRVVIASDDVGEYITLPELDVGNYSLIVLNDGDDNHKLSYKTYDFTVNAQKTAVSIEPIGDVIYGGDVVVNFNVSDGASGDVIVSILKNDVVIANRTVNTTVNQVIFKGLEVSNYKVSVEYLGDDNHLSAKNTASFSVSRAESSVLLEAVSEMIYGHDVIFKITVVNCSAATYYLFKGNIPVDNGDVNDYITLSNLNAGDYHLSIVNEGGDNYKLSYVEYNFTVEKSPTEVLLSLENITYGEDLIVKFNITSGAGGNVNISILNETKTVDSGDGSAVFKNLNASEYNVLVEYLGDDNHKYSNTTLNFTVSKAASQIEISPVSNVVYPSDVLINVELTNGSECSYVLFKNNTWIASGNLTDNILTGLGAGNYTIIITNEGDENHNSSFNKTGFTIYKKESKINLQVLNISYLEDAFINITVPDGQKSNVSLIIHGENSYYFENNYEITVGEIIKISNLNASKYNVYVKYHESENYNASELNTSFTVAKTDSNITVSVLNAGYGENSLIKVNGASSNLTIRIANQTYDLNGSELIVNDLNAGVYEFVVIFKGDENYNPGTVNSTLNIGQAQTSVQSRTGNITYGENLIINVTSGVGGILTVKINETLNQNFNVTSGINFIKIENLNSGRYNISLILNPTSANYRQSINKTDFEVFKKDINFQITADDTVYGQPVRVNILADVDGYAVIKLGNLTKETSANYITFDGLDAGSYEVSAEFIAGDNYNTAYSKTDFRILPAQSAIIADVENINYGDMLLVNITSNLDGNVEVKLANITKEAALTKGVLKTFNFGILNHGFYDIEITFDGGDNYNKTVITKHVQVAKTRTDIDVNINNASYGEDTVISIKSPVDGKVTLRLNNETVTGFLNKNTSFNFGVLNAGSFTVYVTFTPDESNYHEISSSYNFKVNPAKSYVTVTTSPITFNHTAIFNITSNSIADAVIKIDGKNYSANVNSITGIDGINAGEFTVEVVLKDSQNFRGSKNTTVLVVNRADIDLDIKNGIYSYGEDVIINISTNADGKLQINNKNYTVKKNTINRLNLGVMPSGINNIEISADAGSNYNKLTVYHEINVSFAKSYVYLEASDITAGQKAVIKVNTNTDGRAVITINGEVYTVNVSAKTATLEIAGLKPSTYDVGVIFTADNYEISQNTTKLNVGKIKDYTINTMLTDDVLTVTLPGDASGDLKITFNNKTLTATLKNAKAVFENMPAGNYNVLVSYSGDDKYDAGSIETAVNVENRIKITAHDVVKYYHGPERFNIHISDKLNQSLANVKVNITINGQTYTRTTNNTGYASIALGLNSGNYTVVTSLNSTNITSNVSILPTISGKDITKVFKNQTQYYATFMDSEGNLLKNTEIQFNINGVFYKRTTDDNGRSKLTINLNQGTYILTAINPVTDEMYTNTVQVLATISENADITKYYRNATAYIVKLIGSDGKAVGAGEKVTFNINGVFYERTTNLTGHAKLNINLEAGNYIITAEYMGCRESNNICVLPVLSANDLKMTYRDGSQFKAKLVDGQGYAYANMSVQFNINGVFYFRQTDAEGIAVLNINLQSGEYIITSSYNGCNIANLVKIDPF